MNNFFSFFIVLMKSESIEKMASIDESSEAAVLDQNDAVKIAASCLNDPNYAIICVFLQKFGSQLKIEHPDFLRLQKMIEDTDEGKAEKTIYNNNRIVISM